MKRLFSNGFLLSLLTSLFVLMSASPTSAEISEVKNISWETFTLVSRVKSSGKKRWQSKVRLQIIEGEGKTFVYSEEKGEESFGEIKRYKIWDSFAYSYLEGEKVIPHRIKVVIRNNQGKIIEDVNIYYDCENKKIICHVNDKVKEFEFKEHMVDKQNVAVWLMNYPFEEEKDLDFHLLTHAPALYKMNMKYKGKEGLIIGNRKVECYRLEMLPDLGLLNFLRIFYPKTYFWVETKPPHYFVRYEGLESGLGTPYVVLEATKGS